MVSRSAIAGGLGDLGDFASNMCVASVGKGLSAQYVFLVGVHDGELPRAANDPQDLEICRFIVGLTRTKKKCSILITKRFAGTQFKSPSIFLRWISEKRLTPIEVDAAYWKAN